MKHDPLNLVLGEPGPDAGCDVAFEYLDRYCEAVRRGVDVTLEFPDIARHLRNCVTCREDTEGLLAVLAQESKEDE